jgi:hypothetical protein
MPEVSPSKWVGYMGWQDVPHLDEATKEDLLRSYPPHEREARSRGEPALGSGAIYPIPEAEILCDPFPIPPYWPRAYGLDVGWRKTAAVWGAWDRSTDTVYLYSEYGRAEAEPSVHAAAIKARGDWIPGVIDPASRGRQQADGRQLITMYRQAGLKVSEADNAVEAGIYAVYERLSTSRLKVFTTLQGWRAEYRQYHRDENGKVVKQNDHCLHPDTQVLTRRGRYAIRDLVGTEGEVLSLNGKWQRYRSCRQTAQNQEIVTVAFDDGSQVTCTPDHKFYTQEGWVEARDMVGRYCYNAVSQSNQHGAPCKSTSSLTRSKSSAASGIIGVVAISKETVSACIGWFGKLSTAGLFLTAGMSTTSTTTRPTTSRTTSPFCRCQSTGPITARSAPTFRQKRGRLRANGTSRTKAGAGTLNTISGSSIGYIRSALRFALTVMRSLKRRVACIALTPVSLPHGGRPAWITRRGPAKRAGALSRPTDTQSPGRAAESVLVRCRAVRSAGRSDVYCLTVPATSAFAVESGVIVHNCMDAGRYLVMSGLSLAKVEPPRSGVAAGSRIGDSTAGY